MQSETMAWCKIKSDNLSRRCLMASSKVKRNALMGPSVDFHPKLTQGFHPKLTHLFYGV